MYKDPICGMDVDSNSTFKVEKDGKNYFFCSQSCKDKFIAQKGQTKEGQHKEGKGCCG